MTNLIQNHPNYIHLTIPIHRILKVELPNTHLVHGPNVLDGKLEEYLTMQTGDHRPNVKSRHFAKPKTKKNKQKKNKGVAKIETKERAENVEDGKSGTFDKSEKDKGKSKPKKKKNCGRDVKIARGKYFVDGPPILTVRQAELYGLKEYGSDAVRDGVRLDQDSTLKWGAAGKWHVDGAHFQHFIDSKEVGLLPIFIFTTIGPRDGGTLLCQCFTWRHIESH